MNSLSKASPTSGTKQNGEQFSKSVSEEGERSITKRLTGIITHSFPKHLRKEAISLLLFLLKYGKGVFHVQGWGSFLINGRKMDSSIIDYIFSSLANERTHHRPGDFNYFQIAMDQINVPAHLMSKTTSKRTDLSVKSKSRKWLPY